MIAGAVLAAQWQTAEPKETALGTRFRHSAAGGCARQLGFAALGVAPSDPMDLSGAWQTGLGTLVHEALQDAWETANPALAPYREMKVRSWEDGSGHIDGYDPALREGREVKTTGEYGFCRIAGLPAGYGAPKPAEGPKPEHRLQAGLNVLGMRAAGLDVESFRFTYLWLSALSHGRAARAGVDRDSADRFCSEWVKDANKLSALGDREVLRQRGVAEIVDAGYIPGRGIGFPGGEWPEDAVVDDVGSSRWVSASTGETGKAWSGQLCSYCPFRSRCEGLGSGMVAV